MQISDIQAKAMADVDAALQPMLALARSPQPMNTASLATVASAIRQAVSAVVYASTSAENDASVDGPEYTNPVAEGLYEKEAEANLGPDTSAEQVTETAAVAEEPEAHDPVQPEPEVLTDPPAEAEEPELDLGS